ncbi:HopJ type III effector protein [Tenacibaculum soleae]|uniref:HopJ type III effector protein n=1 Tax=Tenacibaculum soleae TaxID=447689 RepID=UPI0026E34972|nr:HopJ type III effector protein [Tenacibaculum soleae]MDO6745402.1 HopJ type III effector protein [Tenacibaculum soleae]
MSLQDFINKLRNTPKEVVFSETISVIEENYVFTSTAFKNGDLQNSNAENLGSCKVFSFALKQKLTKEETLACFGQYYFIDVLENPNGTDHQNIRSFMNTGFEGLIFENETLVEKV